VNQVEYLRSVSGSKRMSAAVNATGMGASIRSAISAFTRVFDAP
jgi:hypothetical protein